MGKGPGRGHSVSTERIQNPQEETSPQCGWSEGHPGGSSAALGAEASSCCDTQADHKEDRAEEDSQSCSDCRETCAPEEGRIEAGTAYDGIGKRVAEISPRDSPAVRRDSAPERFARWRVQGPLGCAR